LRGLLYKDDLRGIVDKKGNVFLGKAMDIIHSDLAVEILGIDDKSKEPYAAIYITTKERVAKAEHHPSREDWYDFAEMPEGTIEVGNIIVTSPSYWHKNVALKSRIIQSWIKSVKPIKEAKVEMLDISHSNAGHPLKLRVTVNPTYSELTQMLRTNGGAYRMIITNKSIYYWSAYLAIHRHVSFAMRDLGMLSLEGGAGEEKLLAYGMATLPDPKALNGEWQWMYDASDEEFAASTGNGVLHLGNLWLGYFMVDPKMHPKMIARLPIFQDYIKRSERTSQAREPVMAEAKLIKGLETRVWMNPTYSETAALSKQFDLRGLLTKDAMYVWKAFDDGHLGMMHTINSGADYDNFTYSIYISSNMKNADDEWANPDATNSFTFDDFVLIFTENFDEPKQRFAVDNNLVIKAWMNNPSVYAAINDYHLHKAGYVTEVTGQLRVTPTQVNNAGHNKSQVLVLMPATDFLRLTTKDAAHVHDIEQEALPLYKYNQFAKRGHNRDYDKFLKDRTPDTEGGSTVHPFLLIDIQDNNRAYVFGHEGRHRAAALIKKGGSMMQIALQLRPGESFKKYAKFYGQEYHMKWEDVPPYIQAQFNGEMVSTKNWKVVQDDILAQYRRESIEEDVETRTSYGFWVKANGSVVSVGSMAHDQGIMDHFGMDTDSLYVNDHRPDVILDSYPNSSFGIAKGWIRGVLVLNDYFSIEFSVETVTPAALKEVVELMKLYKDRMYFDINDTTYKSFGEAYKVLNDLYRIVAQRKDMARGLKLNGTLVSIETTQIKNLIDSGGLLLTMLDYRFAIVGHKASIKALMEDWLKYIPEDATMIEIKTVNPNTYRFEKSRIFQIRDRTDLTNYVNNLTEAEVNIPKIKIGQTIRIKDKKTDQKKRVTIIGQRKNPHDRRQPEIRTTGGGGYRKVFTFDIVEGSPKKSDKN
jgi:hypothetical protein